MRGGARSQAAEAHRELVLRGGHQHAMGHVVLRDEAGQRLHHVGHDGACVVAAGSFDLDHLGPQVGQQHRCRGAGDEGAVLDDTHPV